MSIRTVQTKFRASASSFPVLTTIDTNTPPVHLVHKTQDLHQFAQPSNAPIYHGSLSLNRRSSSPASANIISTLSPHASPYKPRSTYRQSQMQAQNQHQYQQQTQRTGARAGRGIPAVQPTHRSQQVYDPDLTVKYPPSMALGGMSPQSTEPLFTGVPTYSHSSRFDPFGDYSSPEKASVALPLPTSPPANTHDFKQSFGASTGSGPAYTHFYYYDKATNSPTLAYGSRQGNTRHTNYNQRTQWNTKAKGINNNSNNYYTQPTRRPNNSFSHSPSPPSTYIPVVQQKPVSRSPSPPSPSTPALVASSVTFPSTSTKAEDPFADPVPTRTRKRSNTISEGAVQPTAPKAPAPAATSTTPLPEPKPKVSLQEKKSDNSLASKLVAAMLLNRVDATGRSRCSGSASKRIGGPYVKSGLSRVMVIDY